MFIGLRAELSSLPPLRPARSRVWMEPFEPHAFDGFAAALRDCASADYTELRSRIRLDAIGLRTLYVAHDEEQAPLYAQWLVPADEQPRLARVMPGAVDLRDDEAIVEGAFTFPAARARGVMIEGMGRLLRVARSAGIRAVVTYVHSSNVPSLRGCAAVGFQPDHVRLDTWRLGRLTSEPLPLDDRTVEGWRTSTHGQRS